MAYKICVYGLVYVIGKVSREHYALSSHVLGESEGTHRFFFFFTLGVIGSPNPHIVHTSLVISI